MTERHFARLDPNGVVLDVIVCPDEETAVALGHPLELHPGVDEHGPGWRTPDGGETWIDERGEIDPSVRRFSRG